ncbi:hypothetical protein POX_e07023 [Penicillium oxalicum]|uniref:hypothetical protein n=1 Tax=Penicillium oxalicum TaxID=69781 RepID=UPI0020B84B8E|nr:hypothetical protein POX_e07023 [Penicillium oxalicum]KAI2788997.1 hypothetical protein POX_e07023 [Penicillium oxalicum]
MTNPPRLTRNSVPPSFPKEFDTLTSFLDDQMLTPKSKLDEFRRFFDLKTEWWNRFHKQLKSHVLLTSNWAEVLENETSRQNVAAEYLDQVGDELWGKENQEKYLIEEHVQSGQACVYPRDRKTMIKALAFLLQKDAKNRRESISHEISFPNLKVRARPAPSSSSSLSEPPPSEGDSPSSIKMNNSRASTPARLFKVPKVSGSPLTWRMTHGPNKLHHAEPDASARPIEDLESVDDPHPSAETSWTSSAVVTRAASPHEEGSHAQLCCQETTMDFGGTFLHDLSDTAYHSLATYFLVQEDCSSNTPVCVPFCNFDDYRTTNEFLDEMEKRCCCAHEPSMLQLFEDVRQYSYAVVSLQWSGVSFVLRRETDDLQSLANRIGCAWRAKGAGELQTFEFVVKVTLKKDPA